ncbi:flavin monoamine oxidase family protein [Methylomonas rosea]|uniref:FAD-dependent oxidoreductase n=1 Tax=Methylomonas rosea TaxID=2952227 RepID=A0ABT1TR90_9GAMM|nr:FAD-dependent oxidoreductase [Methylomonas sp. WSC-7]MCQ8117290.1 FAD-dependent oxidoreductase [Methylomonas sp. WSC-7]
MPNDTDGMMPMLDVAIIGAGLSGLSLAEKLLPHKPNIGVFEARERCGGRILSAAGPTQDFTADLGPTWLWPADQQRISALAERLGLTLFPQWDRGQSLYQVQAEALPATYIDTQTHADARRIAGGCQQLINGLLQGIPERVLQLGHRLMTLSDQGRHVDLIFATDSAIITHQARQVVLAAPPRLLANSISFEPALAPGLLSLMQETPTWMAGHAKAVLVYEQAFWRQQGYSGNAISPYPSAVLAEVYDACSDDAGTSALFGFFGLPAQIREQYQENLPALIVRQMVGLFGPAAANPLSVVIQDWSREPFTATAADRIPVFEHPVYGHRALQLDHWQDKLYFCGTETASRSGGYLEGALEASDRVFSALTL